MKFNAFILILLAALFFVSCDKENVRGPDVLEIPEVQDEMIVINPLVGRSTGVGEEGLEFDCIKILYPFQMVDSEGGIHDITEEDDLNIDLGEEVYIIDFVYPFSVEVNDLEDSVGSAEELVELFAECVPAGGWYEDFFPAYSINFDNSCYLIGYPLSLQDIDGNVLVVEDDNELNNAVADQNYSFVFPFTLIDEDDLAIQVDDIDALFEALISCNGFEIDDTSYFEWETGFDYIGCYLIEFPLAVIISDGSVVTVENHMELCDLMLEGQMVSYAFPLTLSDEEGTTIIVDNQEDLDELVQDCFNNVPFGGGIFELLTLLSGHSDGCYEIHFPLELVGSDGTTITIADEEEDLEAVLNNASEDMMLEYPVTVTASSDGTEVSFQNAEEMLVFLSGC